MHSASANSHSRERASNVLVNYVLMAVVFSVTARKATDACI